jgi:hypothetical protein
MPLPRPVSWRFSHVPRRDSLVLPFPTGKQPPSKSSSILVKAMIRKETAPPIFGYFLSPNNIKNQLFLKVLTVFARSKIRTGIF